jgi:hypothetical protein
VLGAGLGLSFPILSAAALSCIGRENMGNAASLYNMTRNTGAAVGIAYLTSMLVRNQQMHQSYLVQHFSVFDAWRLSNTTSLTPGAPAFHFLSQIVSGQKLYVVRTIGTNRAREQESVKPIRLRFRRPPADAAAAVIRGSYV